MEAGVGVVVTLEEEPVTLRGSTCGFLLSPTVEIVWKGRCAGMALLSPEPTTEANLQDGHEGATNYLLHGQSGSATRALQECPQGAQPLQ